MGRFFVWLSGANPDMVPPGERSRFGGLGALLTIPALLGFVSMSYAVSTITSNRAIYWSAGVLWAMAVIAVDRYLVSTVMKADPSARHGRGMAMVVRYVLAIFVGVAVSHPLVMLWFDQSISQELALQRQAREQWLVDKAEAGKAAVPVGAVSAELNQKVGIFNCLGQLITAEQSGVKTELPCGVSSGLPECGQRCLVLANQRRDLQVQIDSLRPSAEAEDVRRREQIQQIENTKLADLDRLRTDFSEDYVARVKAMATLEEREPHVAAVRWFMVLLFIVIDIMPVTLKLSTAPGEYEDADYTRRHQARARRIAERKVVDRVFGSDDFLNKHAAYYSIRDGMTNLADITVSIADQVGEHTGKFDDAVGRAEKSSGRGHATVTDGLNGVWDSSWNRFFTKVRTLLNEA